jgi:iron(III) transport system ATP-binding protein
MTTVRLDKIHKSFPSATGTGKTVALHDIDLTINAGELFFLLGPSGCGKSTLLRLIAGLHEPTSGKIFFNDNDVTELSTEKRNAVMCFQSYALWPHMSVTQNIKFGLEVRGMSDQQSRIEKVLELVKMTPRATFKPNQLSGGQQQRVALARALAVEPACLLLDEPLSNLDAKLRHEMRSEIRRICKTAGFTTIYVTHDQKEALSIGDRIAVMKDGFLQQVGTPGELYHKPANVFVADFIGQTNLIDGTLLEITGERAKVQTKLGTITAVTSKSLTSKAGSNVKLSIRPERLRVTPAWTGQNGDNRVVAKVIESTFLGEATEMKVAANDLELNVTASPPVLDLPPQVTLSFEPDAVVVLAE